MLLQLVRSTAFTQRQTLKRLCWQVGAQDLVVVDHPGLQARLMANTQQVRSANMPYTWDIAGWQAPVLEHRAHCQAHLRRRQ